MKKFTNNWFDGSIPLFNHFLNKFKNKNGLKFLEIGSYEGNSTCHLLKNYLTGEGSEITCIDSWKGGFEHSDIDFDQIFSNFNHNVEEFSNKVKILIGSSYDKLLELQKEKSKFDFIYIDGGHTAKNVLQDSILSFELLKSEGIMAFDDYTWGFNQLPLKKIPKNSIDSFLIAYEDEIQILNKSHQLWIMKK